MTNITLNQLCNSSVWFDPATIYAEVNGSTFILQWDSNRNCFTDAYGEYSFDYATVYDAPITRIDSTQGCGNTLFVVVKLSA